MHDADWDVSNLEYHLERGHVSHSSLEKFRVSPLLYHGIYVAETIEPTPATEAMALGTAFETLLLEPHRWDELIALRPECDRRTTVGKGIYAAFMATVGDKTVITRDQYAVANEMLQGVQRNLEAVKLLQRPGMVQRSIRWEHDTGVLCKARFDKHCDGDIVIDLKTANEPSPALWVYAANKFGYHRQSALYLVGYREIWNRPVSLIHIVVGSRPPYECGVFELGRRSLELGNEQNRADLERLAECRRTGNWNSPWTNGVQGIDLPRFAFSGGMETLELELDEVAS